MHYRRHGIYERPDLYIVGRVYDVWVNGRFVSRHDGGAAPFPLLRAELSFRREERRLRKMKRYANR